MDIVIRYALLHKDAVVKRSYVVVSDARQDECIDLEWCMSHIPLGSEEICIISVGRGYVTDGLPDKVVEAIQNPIFKGKKWSVANAGPMQTIRSGKTVAFIAARDDAGDYWVAGADDSPIKINKDIWERYTASLGK